MISILGLACGVMAAAGTYLIIQRRPFDLLMGLSLIGHAVNLAIFVSSNAKSSLPSIMKINQSVLENTALDPVPQALILTAIVISFGTTTLLAVLFRTSLQRSNLECLDSNEKGAD